MKRTILMARLQLSPRLRIPPSSDRPLRFHYTGGAQCTLVDRGGFSTHSPSTAGAAPARCRWSRSPSSRPPGAPHRRRDTERQRRRQLPVAQGGTLTVGVWQAPTTLLDAGIVGSLPFADVIAAPVEEGLLWYRATSATARRRPPRRTTGAPTSRPRCRRSPTAACATSGCADTAAAMCVTWHLRQGVMWDDGSDLTAHDVCDTFEFHWLAYGAAGQAEPDPARVDGGMEPGDQVHRARPVHGGRRLQDAVRTLPRARQRGRRHPARVRARPDPRRRWQPRIEHRRTFDLTRGRATLPHSRHRQPRQGARRHRALRDVELHAGRTGGPRPQPGLLEPERPCASRQAHLQDRARPRHRGEGRAVRGGGGRASTSGSRRCPASPRPRTGAHRRLSSVDAVAGSGARGRSCSTSAPPTAGCATNPAEHENEDTADPTVRRAILLGIDRQAIVDAVAPGMTSVPGDSCMNLGAATSTPPKCPTTAFDLAQANAILDGAGDARNAKCGSAPDGQDYRALKDGTCIVIDLGTTATTRCASTIESMVKAIWPRSASTCRRPSRRTCRRRRSSRVRRRGPLETHAFDMALFTVSARASR